MKKGTLAATALAVGAGATGTYGSVVAQQEDDDEEEEGEVVIHGHDYYPGGEFTVLAELETLSRNDLLEHLDEDEAVFDDVDDWDVYVIGIEAGEAGPLGHLMVEENGEISPSPGDTGTMDETASIRDPGLNLLELDVTLEEVDEDDDEVDDEEVDDEEVDDEEVDDEEVDDEEVDDEEVDDEEVDDEEVDDEEVDDEEVDDEEVDDEEVDDEENNDLFD